MYLQAINQCLSASDFTQASALCDQWLLLEPNNHYTKALKGWCIYKNGDVGEAEKCLLDALYAEPSHQEIVTLVFSFYMATADYHQLIKVAQGCIAFHPNNRSCWHRLGTAHYFVGEYDSSVSAFRHSLSIEYSASSSFGLSQPLLSLGAYEEGYARYEDRFDANRSINWLQSEKLPMPKWQGEPLSGKSILVWSEQGLGDSIQFSRLLTLLSAQGALVDLMLQPQHATLYDVLSTVKGINAISVVENKTVTLKRRYDYHSPMMSLMGLLKITPIASHVANIYLSTPVSHTNKWKKYQSIPKKKVGIVWTTLVDEHTLNNHRMIASAKMKKSIPLEQLASLFSLPTHCFFPLQTFISAEDQKILSQYDNIYDVSQDLADFSDTAAMIDEMDLVISVDTAVAHLSAAMGKKTINVLANVSDWRWQKNRDDVPWYPSMTLCRQVFEDDWSQIADKLLLLLK